MINITLDDHDLVKAISGRPINLGIQQYSNPQTGLQQASTTPNPRFFCAKCCSKNCITRNGTDTIKISTRKLFNKVQ